MNNCSFLKNNKTKRSNNMSEDDLNLLTSLYQNCKTATQSLHDILPKVMDMKLLQELKTQYNTYLDFISECLDCAHKNGQTLCDNSLFEKMRLWTSIKMTTLFDKSTRHLAEMLLLGTVMGTLQCYKDASDHKNADQNLLQLCQKLLEIEEDNFNRLKTFLKDM